MSLRSFIEAVDGVASKRITVVSDDAPGPLQGMLAETFDEQPVDVDSADAIERPAGDLDPDVAATLKSADETAVLFEDGTPTAASSMADLYESILAVNSDLFVSGARGLGEIELPDVLAGLEDTRLRLRGYPLAHKEKLLLILVSRYIEQLAWLGEAGTIRSAFQKLSRIDDEIGTRRVYGKLDRAGVDVHVYGVDDGLDVPFEPTVHAGTEPRYRNSWFVVYRPDGAPTDRAGALVCLEDEPRIWDGFFTFEPDRVAAIDEAISAEFGPAVDTGPR
ncbi:histidine kinase [Natrialbaceae archaeon A-arb3/5]